MSRIAIICVDDEEIILCSLGEQLKRNLGNNYDIELASNGYEALSLCAELEAEGITIALVISDQMMPGMSGDEFLIKLHKFYPKALKILLTGQAGVNSIGQIVNEGALYRYITKPWDETDLIMSVKEALRSYEQETQLVQQYNLLQQSNEQLSKSLDLLLATFEADDDGILVLDDQDNIIIFNQQLLALWQIYSDTITNDGNQLLSLILQQIAKPFVCNLEARKHQYNTQKMELLTLTNGRILESYFQTQKLKEEVVGQVWRFRDVTDKERAKAIAKHQALHDTLTQLPKRTILKCQLSEAIIQAAQNSSIIAVIFVDLDRFKMINDTLGHRIGDRVLQSVVKRLKNCLHEKDLITRWGNEEFTLL